MPLRTIPNTPRYAILTDVSVHIPGDERSRTNPGHGYPESTEYYQRYEAFDNRAEWEAMIGHMTTMHKSFKAFYVTPAKIETKVSVSVTYAAVREERVFKGKY